MAKQVEAVEQVVAGSEDSQWQLAANPAGAAVVLSGDGGKTLVMETVVAKIAGLAVREVPGVHALVPYGATQRLTSLAKSISGAEMKDLGVRVEVGTIEAAVDVRIVTDYGASIPEIAAGIRKNLGERVQKMTGLTVKEINIEVVDLYFDEPAPMPSAQRRSLK